MTYTTTCNMSGQPVLPEWIDLKGTAKCPSCGKSYKPTAWKLFRYHMRIVVAA